MRYLVRYVSTFVFRRALLYFLILALAYFSWSVLYGIHAGRSIADSVEIALSAVIDSHGSTALALDYRGAFLYLTWFLGGALLTSFYGPITWIIAEEAKYTEAHGELDPRIPAFLARIAGVLESWQLRFSFQAIVFIGVSLGAAVTSGQTKHLAIFAVGGAGVGLIVGLITKAGLVGLTLKTIYTSTLGYFVTRWWQQHDRNRQGRRHGNAEV